MRRQVSTRIQYIFERFYSTKVEDRFSFLVDFANKFCLALGFPVGVEFHVSRVKIDALVKSHFLDVIRFKEYHFEPHGSNLGVADIHSRRWMEAVHKEKELSKNKVAAFTAKWIMKHSPISVVVDDSVELSFEDEYKINSANAVFAARVSLEFLKIDLLRVDADRFRRFVYHLMYRNSDDRALFGWLECLQEVVVDTKKRTYNVFVASPDDCKELREAAANVILEVNGFYPGELKLNSYMWEHDKRAGATTDYQDDVFSEAHDKWGGSACDVLICFVWHRFGAGTKVEFSRYIDSMIGDSNRCVLFFRYAKDPPLEAINPGSLKDLNDWVAGVEDKIAPLGRRRGAIKSVTSFEQELRRELMGYLKRQAN